MNLIPQGTLELDHGVVNELFAGIITERIFHFQNQDKKYRQVLVRQLSNRAFGPQKTIHCKMVVDGKELFVHLTRGHTPAVSDRDEIIGYTIEAQLELELAEDATAPNNLGKDLS